MKLVNMLVKFANIIIGQNVRLAKNLRLDTLADSIETNGLQEPVTVYREKPDDENILLLRGHRRVAAIGMILARNKARYDALFSEGVPAIVVSGVTMLEATLMKLDHDGQEGLSDPYELQLTANILFAAGKTEAEVIALTSGLMERVSPMSAKARKEIAELENKMEALKGTTEGAIAQRDRDERRLKYRRGMVQGLHNSFRCPNKVMFALYYKATGKAPEGVTEYLPPNLTTGEVTKLWEAHKADMGILENGVPKYSKETVGPNFSALWDKVCADAKADADKPETVRPKAMSASEMTDEIAGRGFESEAFRVLIAYHAGNKELSAALPALDKASTVGDMVRKFDAPLWAQCETAYADIRKRLAAETPVPVPAEVPVEVLVEAAASGNGNGNGKGKNKSK